MRSIRVAIGLARRWRSKPKMRTFGYATGGWYLSGAAECTYDGQASNPSQLLITSKGGNLPRLSPRRSAFAAAIVLLFTFATACANTAEPVPLVPAQSAPATTVEPAKFTPSPTTEPTEAPSPEPTPVPTAIPTPVPTPVPTVIAAPVRTAAPTPKPPAPTAKTANCHPSYVGVCLTPGIGDYDCAGGSGNGPNYIKGPFKVVGPDDYDLDRDNDGIGCE